MYLRNKNLETLKQERETYYLHTHDTNSWESISTKILRGRGRVQSKLEITRPRFGWSNHGREASLDPILPAPGRGVWGPYHLPD